MYILGAAVGKNPYKNCSYTVYNKSRRGVDPENHLYWFYRFKYDSHYPDNMLFEIEMLAFDAFKQRFNKMYFITVNLALELNQILMIETKSILL